MTELPIRRYWVTVWWASKTPTRWLTGYLFEADAHDWERYYYHHYRTAPDGLIALQLTPADRA